MIELIKFVYFDEFGAINYLDSEKIRIKKNSFEVKNAAISHLSTFGFTFLEIPDEEDEDPPLPPSRFGFGR